MNSLPALTHPSVMHLVAAVLIVAAVIDGRQLRVPNWLTFSFFISGLAVAGAVGGGPALGASLVGATVGLACLLPLYAIGGMGAGDVKLMAGIGAWVGAPAAFAAFLASGVAGAAIALVMILCVPDRGRHWRNMKLIAAELATDRNVVRIAARAAERKPNMLLLPYGIPMAVGSLGYFLWSGLI